ncbi:hypothetical protein GC175_31485 [bacterium]|nr:hypothetical protein [bacterium]
MDNLLSSVRSILLTTPERWMKLTETLPSDLLFAPAAEGEWSAIQCLQHMIDTERVFQTRLIAFLEGRDFPDFNPDTQGSQSEELPSPSALGATFAKLRVQSLQSLSQIDDNDLDRQSRHQRLGPVTLRMMIHEWAAHDLSHTVQAEESIMQPFIQGSGPWKQFFADHVKGLGTGD